MGKHLFSILMALCALGTVWCTTRKPSVSVSTTPVILEGEDNNVLIHFMDFKRSEFVEMLPKTKQVYQDKFFDYCKDSETCVDAIGAGVEGFNLGFVGLEEKDKFVEDNRYIIAKTFLTYVNEFNETQYVPKRFLTDFLTNTRALLAKESKIDIAYIDNKFVFPMRNNLDNYIIIPISLAFVLALVIFNFVCQRKRENDLISDMANKPPIYKNSGSKKSNEIELREEHENDEEHRYLEPTPKFPVPDRFESEPMLEPRSVRTKMTEV